MKKKKVSNTFWLSSIRVRYILQLSAERKVYWKFQTIKRRGEYASCASMFRQFQTSASRFHDHPVHVWHSPLEGKKPAHGNSLSLAEPVGLNPKPKYNHGVLLAPLCTIGFKQLPLLKEREKTSGTICGLLSQNDGQPVRHVISICHSTCTTGLSGF